MTRPGPRPMHNHRSHDLAGAALTILSIVGAVLDKIPAIVAVGAGLASIVHYVVVTRLRVRESHQRIEESKQRSAEYDAALKLQHFREWDKARDEA